MGLPPIQPTGAMASGTYVDYMIDWLGSAIDDLEEDVGLYVTDQTATDWYDRWDDTLSDLRVRVTALNINIGSIKSKIIMLKDAIDRKKNL